MEQKEMYGWPAERLFARFGSGAEGLTEREARRRLKEQGPNSLKGPRRGRGLLLFLEQFKSPLILLLVGAAGLSFWLGGRTDGSIICVIVLLSGLLGYFQERGALNALERLLERVETKALVVRDGKEREISVEGVVPGDLVVVAAGDLAPADCVLVEEKHLFVDESALTGESAPVEKGGENKGLFLGTHVASGYGKAVVVATGRETEFGKLAEKVRDRPPETAFEAGVRKFGFFLLVVTLVLTAAIFAFNIVLHRPWIDSFLFALALAVGLTPQLLPAIISVNLSRGARRMARQKVIVKRLASIENFGQMDLLCTDKTGTITEGSIALDGALGPDGQESEKCAFYAFLNAHFQTGYSNPMDRAIAKRFAFDVAGWEKTDENPYDFERKRISVVFSHAGRQTVAVKGAVAQVMAICDRVEGPDGSLSPLDESKEALERLFAAKSEEGFRALAVAYGEGEREEGLIFLGFLFFYDPIKPGIAETVAEMKAKGVGLKILTGDHRAVAAHAAAFLGLDPGSIRTGSDLADLSDEALEQAVETAQVFAEIDPSQKEKIILALRKKGHVVGYLGDGINDVAALHSADVGIAVDSGADAAKEASDIVLLEKNLSVLKGGVVEGRRTFANTIKYVYMATSANFGNMFSMAGASLFLPFLPLLPKQVLLTNLLTDFPEMAIASDRVDPETVVRPVKWDLAFIRRFMIVFGLISSVYDYLTFCVLLYALKADQALFQTGWFLESVVSATVIVLAVRTRRPLFRSPPGKWLAMAVLAVAGGVLFLPFSPLALLFGFAPLPLLFYAALAGILAFYILSVEIAKRFFFRQ